MNLAPESDLRISIVQADTIWRDAAANRALYGDLVRPLAGATDLVVLPETFTSGFGNEAIEQAEDMHGPSVAWVRALAREVDAVVTGSMVVAEGGRIWNRLIWAEPDGGLAWYDKRHLFRMADEHLRYGSGTLHHKVEGEKPAYWTGPSIGFDAGANAGSTFVLVYNLFDTEDLYKRYPAGEGAAYLVGGFNASYMRRGDVVLIPIRVGVGARLGVNAGYMKIRKKQNWVPF